jgi:hypothetical protein
LYFYLFLVREDGLLLVLFTPVLNVIEGSEYNTNGFWYEEDDVAAAVVEELELGPDCET